MKFPINIDAFISAEEILSGEKLSPYSREICERFLKTSNKVYRDARAGKITRNPFGGSVEEDVVAFHEKHGEIDRVDVFIKLMTVLYNWCTLAYNQGLEDRTGVSPR